MILLIAALAMHTSALPDNVKPFNCPAPIVHDGDTLRCHGGESMRLARIDAPELANSPRCRRKVAGMRCDNRAARRSRDNLVRLVSSGQVRCARVDADPRIKGFQWRDRYQRPVVRCQVGGVDLGEAQVKAGFAVRWPDSERSRLLHR